jgi:penicillin-binding protein 1C
MRWPVTKRRLIIVALSLALLPIVLSILGSAAIAIVVRLAPYPTDRLAPAGAQSLALVDRSGQPLRVQPLAGGGRAAWVPLGRVHPLAITATLAGEDHRFFDHGGVDGRALLRAAWLAVRHGRLRSGASTITMQLARTLEPHRRDGRGKLGEMLAALRLERALGKQALLEQYLNRVYYGAGANGIEAAAQRFFGRPSGDLTAGEATLLAVLPRAPSAYDPRQYLDVALRRRSHVLGLMERQGWLSAGDRARIEAEPVTILAAAAAPAEAPHFSDWAMAQLAHTDGAAGAGPRRTTLDLSLQRRLERAVAEHLRGRAWADLRQAGVVVVDPASGAVLAMVGSADHGDASAGQVNIATALRHPGSTLKPFVYALAIEAGAHPASIADDRFGAVPGYRPNRRMRERGPRRYREALAGSFNLAAVDVLSGVGVAPLLERLRQAQLGPLAGSATEYGLDLALGSARVRLVDLAAAYGFLVNGGQVFRARGFETGRDPGVQLFDPVTSWLVMDMLADPAARRSAFGAELPLDLPFPVAAKTGTSSGFADTYTVAATREVVVAAWGGAFDGSGTRGHLAMWSAAPLARAALLAAADRHGGRLTLPPPPPGVVTADVCEVTGLGPGPDCPHKRERFVATRVPATQCPGHALARRDH